MKLRFSLVTSALLGVVLLSGCNSTNTVDTGTGAVLTGWNGYTDEVAGYSFSYPSRVQIFSENDALVLTHSIPYQHPDPCDFRGDGKPLDTLTDFHVTMDMLEKNIRDAVIEKEGSDYVASTYMNGNEFILDRDSPVEAVSFRDLKGYTITSGVEGCGQKTYYFVSPSGRTFVVTRKLIAEFSPVHPDADQMKAIPGVLPPEQEDLLFQRLMTTIVLRP